MPSEPQEPRRDPAEAARLVLFVAGMILIAYGAWRIFAPAGYITAGALMFGCAVVGAWRAGGRA